VEKPGHLMICAECSVQVGTGHVMRCLALAQAWKRAGGAVTFLGQEGLAGIEERIRGEGISLRTLPNCGSSADAFVESALSADAQYAVLDGYGFGESQQSRLSEAGVRVLMVDDYGHAAAYPARWILNPNAHATAEMYTGTKARLLLGSSYALIRDEFLPWVRWKRLISDRCRKILITIGGSDPDNVSEKILRSIQFLECKDLEVLLVVGGASPHLQDVQAASERSPVPVKIVHSVRDMPARMAWADVAISGAGGTSHELCYMGLPALLLVIAENQRRNAERLAQMGVAVNGGTSREFHPELFASQLQALIESAEARTAMSQGARDLVDGLGSERVRAALLDRELKLRFVRESDCRFLFDWAVDLVARAASFHSQPISWEDHTHWFRERLQDPHSVLYIGESAEDEPVGLVRFHVNEDRAVVSVNVAPTFRSKGWGRELITLATRMLVRARSVSRVEAFIRPDNQASIQLFGACGFQLYGKERVLDQDALLFTWESGSEVHAD
jgi:UDP-2,4-diacetamido-2,4,6-trideoxy-beta-L-altropyranose hydrolase